MGLITWIKEKFKKMFKTNKTIGYVQLFFKIIGEKEIYYSAFNGDFGKPLSWLRLQSLKKSMRKAYKEFDKIYSVEFCSKEEWEKNRSEDEISFKWGDYDE